MTTLDSTELRRGTVFKYNGRFYLVLNYKHVKKGRGLAIIRVKVRDIESNATLEKTFTSNEKVESADLIHTKAQYLYSDSDGVYFMDNRDYSQFQLNNVDLKWERNFLIEGSKVDVIWLEDKVVGIQLQKKVKLKVKYTEPAVMGDTAASATKKAELETGYTLQVPLFIENNDLLIINTESGDYVSKG